MEKIGMHEIQATPQVIHLKLLSIFVIAHCSFDLFGVDNKHDVFEGISVPEATSVTFQPSRRTLVPNGDIEIVQGEQAEIQDADVHNSIRATVINPSVFVYNYRHRCSEYYNRQLAMYGDESCCGATLEECARCDRNALKACARAGTCCLLLVAMPTLLGCFLPIYTQHIRNTTPYDLLINCVGSSRTLHAGMEGRLRCSSKPIGAMLCATAPWHSGVEGGCATGKEVKHTNTFELSLSSCDLLENSCLSYCDGVHGDDGSLFITWTPVLPVENSTPHNITQNVTQSVVPAWNSKNLGYVSDITEKLGNLRGMKK